VRIALRSAKEPWEVVDAQQTFGRNVIHNNVGNLVFSQAVHRALASNDNEVHSNRFKVSAAEVDRINNECDAFVVPLANAFRNQFSRHLVKLADMIEQLTVPVVVIGVGAQAKLHHGTGHLDSLNETVKRFVSAVLERSATIGVRGEFTADYLSSLGFSAVDVIGCPSMYMWGSDLSVSRKVDALTPKSKVSINVSTYVRPMGPILTHQMATYPGLTYLAQDHFTLGRMLGEEPDAENPPADLPVRMSHPIFTEGKARFFLDPMPWIKYLGERDFSMGSRIHGNIVALLGGTPAMVLAHDSRTLELARFHRIPHERIKRIKPETDAAQLYESLDLDALNAAHPGNFENYVQFLERNGLPHIWQPGQGAVDFDRQIASTAYPEPVRVGGSRNPLRRAIPVRRRRTD
jgi:Polysaccharide pyruvyl transferase